MRALSPSPARHGSVAPRAPAALAALAVWAALIAPVTAQITIPDEAARRETALAMDLARHLPDAQFSIFGQQGGPDRARASAGLRGGFGVGNGAVFALQGLDRHRSSTLHGLVGPDYEKPGGFFGDVQIDWRIGGRLGGTPSVPTERVFRLAEAPVTVTHGFTARGDLFSVTFAPVDAAVPWPAPLGSDVAQPAMILHLLGARNTSSHGLTIDAAVTVAGVVEAADGALIQRRPGRAMRVSAPGARVEGERLRVPLGEVPPGERRWTVVTIAFARDGGRGVRAPTRSPAPADPPASAAFPAAPADPWPLLKRTVRWWRRWAEGSLTIDSDDPWPGEFLQTQKLLIKVQQSAAGASCPMSRYSGTWTRDLTGPVFFFARAGLEREARAFLDYYYEVARRRGGIANANPVVLAEAGPPPAAEPDWLAGDPFTGRNAAEGPSYIPLQYERYVRWTGDRSILDGRRDFLLHTVLRQAIDDRGLLPFSGDETFREMLKVAFGLPQTMKVEDRYYSANSSILYLQATDALRRLFPDLWSRAESAARAPSTGSGQALRERYERVRAALDRHYRLPDGTYAALIDRETLAVVPQPYEDVSFGWWWAATTDDPGRWEALEALAARLDRGDRGFFTAPPGPRPRFMGLDLSGGLISGMTPGYALSALAQASDPRAERQYQALRRFVRPSGTVDEVHLGTDFAAVHPLYDRLGTGIELAARYRPWEGGIVAEAVIEYLAGLSVMCDDRPAAAPAAGPHRREPEATLVVRPQLPAGARRLRVDHLPLPLRPAEWVQAIDADTGICVTMLARAGTEPCTLRLARADDGALVVEVGARSTDPRPAHPPLGSYTVGLTLAAPAEQGAWTAETGRAVTVAPRGARRLAAWRIDDWDGRTLRARLVPAKPSDQTVPPPGADEEEF